MLTAKEAKSMMERLQSKNPTTLVLSFVTNHYKVLGLPSGKKFTDKQLSEALEAKLLTFFSEKSENLTLEEAREKLPHIIEEATLKVCSLMNLKESHDFPYAFNIRKVGCIAFLLPVYSYYVLTDPEQREFYENWWTSVKWLQRMKIIGRNKENMAEFDLVSNEDFLRLCKLYPWIVGGLVITFPVYYPAWTFWSIGKSRCKAIQSAALKLSGTFTDDKKAGECSSGGEDIQDLPNEDDCC